MLFSTKKEKSADDTELVRRILNNDERAWAEFVEQYTNWVFFKACQWTRRSGFFYKWTGTAVIHDKKKGKKYAYPEEAHDVYLWLFEQLKMKLKKYTGDLNVSLSDFVWAALQSYNLFKDYLRWKHGDPRKIPQALQGATENEKEVFKLLRMRKSVEQIASQIQAPIDEAEKMAKSVIETLIREGLEDMVLPPIEVEFMDDAADMSAKPAKRSSEDWMLLDKVCAAYQNAVSELPPEEKLLLSLFYNVGLQAEEVLENYRAVDMRLPGGKPPNELQAKEVYKTKDKVEEKLLELFRQKCEHLQDVVINENTLKTFLDQLGLEFE